MNPNYFAPKLGIRAFTVLLSLLISTVSTFAAESSALRGRWEIVSVKFIKSGQDVTKTLATGPCKVGAIWILRQDGSGKMGTEEFKRWEYDGDDSELKIYVKQLWYEVEGMKAHVKFKDHAILLNGTGFLGGDFEIFLAPEQR